MLEAPRFIVIEGIDGSGSTTQVERLAVAMRERGHAVLRTAEPSSGPVGVLIRQILQHRVVVPTESGTEPPDWSTMALLFAADRLDHVQAQVAPALARGESVVCDRYTLSSLAYQSLTAPIGQRDLDWLREINAQALVPDLTIVLDVDAEVAMSRRAARAGQTELFETDELQRALAEAYERAETLLPTTHRVVHVDGNRGADQVFADVERAVAGPEPPVLS